jgi:hypothetical protein
VRAGLTQWHSVGLRSVWSGARIPTGAGNSTPPLLLADRLRGPSSLLSSGYQGLLPWGQSGRGVKPTTHLHTVLRPRMRGATPPLPQHALMARRSAKAQGQLNACYMFRPYHPRWFNLSNNIRRRL